MVAVHHVGLCFEAVGQSNASSVEKNRDLSDHVHLNEDREIDTIELAMDGGRASWNQSTKRPKVDQLEGGLGRARADSLASLQKTVLLLPFEQRVVDEEPVVERRHGRMRELPKRTSFGNPDLLPIRPTRNDRYVTSGRLS